MKIVARKPSPDCLLLEYWLPEDINTAGPLVTLAWQLPFGQKKRTASVNWSAVGPQRGRAALLFANIARSAAMVAMELETSRITEDQLLQLWGAERELPWTEPSSMIPESNASSESSESSPPSSPTTPTRNSSPRPAPPTFPPESSTPTPDSTSARPILLSTPEVRGKAKRRRSSRPTSLASESGSE